MTHFNADYYNFTNTKQANYCYFLFQKVVTNDHVLALVKLREEEESSTEETKHIPKLTRSKMK